MLANQIAVNDLRWKKFPVLSDGFVTLVDVMGDDNAVAQAARVSYGNDNPKTVCYDCDGACHDRCHDRCQDIRNMSPCPVCHGVGHLNKKGHPWKENSPDADRDLIRRLMRHRHTTPFEMCEVKILVRVPMDTWRQWIRHRTANVNEYSTRYGEAIDSMDATKPDQWRLQADANRQGSDGMLTDWPEGVQVEPYGNTGRFEVKNAPIHYLMNSQLVEGETTPGHLLSLHEEKFHAIAEDIYQQRLKFGVAREQARKDLPLSTYTEAYWKCDLHNILGFLALRMDGHAQLEIREYAKVIGEQIIKPLFPVVWSAFEDYRLGALMLTRLDIEVVSNLSKIHYPASETIHCDNILFHSSCLWPEEWRGKEKCRERDECIIKLKRLGLITD